MYTNFLQARGRGSVLLVNKSLLSIRRGTTATTTYIYIRDNQCIHYDVGSDNTENFTSVPKSQNYSTQSQDGATRQ